MDGTIGNNLPRIKVTNQFAIREAIYKYGPISRLDISNLLDLTFPTITTNISLMLSKGLLKEEYAVSGTTSNRGRKTMLVDFVPTSRIFLGVEMRRHNSYATVVDLRGNTIAFRERTVFHDDYEGSLKEACFLASDLLRDNGIEFSSLSGFGFCLPGIVDSEAGILKIHPRFGWKDKSVRDDVRRLTGYEGDITLMNNTCARVYGASLFSHGVFKGADHAAYMYVGTGIKCPLIFNLRSHFGTIVGEGEVGHMVMDSNGPLCECGNHGCLESYASDNSIIAAIRSAAESGRSPELKKMMEDHELTIEDLLEAEEKGDEAAIEIAKRAIKYLALAIANVNNFVKPDCVVLECRLFGLDENRKMLEDMVAENLSWNSILDYELSFVDCSNHNGARGAAAGAIVNNLQVFME